jgi:hypothetical protein
MQNRGPSENSSIRALQALAKAFDRKPGELLPRRGTSVKTLHATWLDNGRVWLRVNQTVSPDPALKILAILGPASSDLSFLD